MNDVYATRCTLLERARNQHDSLAWEELLEIYNRYIYVIIRSMNVTPSDADELLQVVSIKLWEALPQFDYKPGQSKFRSWVSRITRNAVLNFLRSQRIRLEKLDNREKIYTIEYLDSITVPDVEVLEQREWAHFVTNTALDAISEQFTEEAMTSFDLYVKGTTVKDIAEQIGVGERSVYKYIKRIRTRLMDEIAMLEKQLDL